MKGRRLSPASRFALRFIATYRAEVSPRLGHVCGSTPTCSAYGEQAFRERGFLPAALLTVRHIASCRPPGVDAPTPPAAGP